MELFGLKFAKSDVSKEPLSEFPGREQVSFEEYLPSLAIKLMKELCDVSPYICDDKEKEKNNYRAILNYLLNMHRSETYASPEELRRKLGASTSTRLIVKVDDILSNEALAIRDKLSKDDLKTLAENLANDKRQLRDKLLLFLNSSVLGMSINVDGALYSERELQKNISKNKKSDFESLELKNKMALALKDLTELKTKIIERVLISYENFILTGQAPEESTFSFVRNNKIFFKLPFVEDRLVSRVMAFSIQRMFELYEKKEKTDKVIPDGQIRQSLSEHAGKISEFHIENSKMRTERKAVFKNGFARLKNSVRKVVGGERKNPKSVLYGFVSLLRSLNGTEKAEIKMSEEIIKSLSGRELYKPKYDRHNSPNRAMRHYEYFIVKLVEFYNRRKGAVNRETLNLFFDKIFSKGIEKNLIDYKRRAARAVFNKSEKIVKEYFEKRTVKKAKKVRFGLKKAWVSVPFLRKSILAVALLLHAGTASVLIYKNYQSHTAMRHTVSFSVSNPAEKNKHLPQYDTSKLAEYLRRLRQNNSGAVGKAKHLELKTFSVVGRAGIGTGAGARIRANLNLKSALSPESSDAQKGLISGIGLDDSFARYVALPGDSFIFILKRKFSLESDLKNVGFNSVQRRQSFALIRESINFLFKEGFLNHKKYNFKYAKLDFILAYKAIDIAGLFFDTVYFEGKRVRVLDFIFSAQNGKRFKMKSLSEQNLTMAKELLNNSIYENLS